MMTKKPIKQSVPKPHQYTIEEQNEGIWQPIVKAFDNRDDAEKYALALSIANERLYRVVLPQGYSVFKWGALVMLNASGTTTVMPQWEPASVTDDEVFELHIIQNRISHEYNNGRFDEWKPANNNRYLSLEDATAECLALSKADTDTYEYRAIPETHIDIAKVYRKGICQPDCGLMDRLIDAQMESDDYNTTIVKAATALIKKWANNNSELLSAIAQEMTSDA